jgi:hypothetical protein
MTEMWSVRYANSKYSRAGVEKGRSSQFYKLNAILGMSIEIVNDVVCETASISWKVPPPLSLSFEPPSPSTTPSVSIS